jgi:hypothetical protein
MGHGRLGQGRSRESAAVDDLIVCIDAARASHSGHTRRFIGLVLDKYVTACKIQVVDSGKEIYWPMTATYLWKETNEY